MIEGYSKHSIMEVDHRKVSDCQMSMDLFFILGGGCQDLYQVLKVFIIGLFFLLYYKFYGLLLGALLTIVLLMEHFYYENIYIIILY